MTLGIWQFWGALALAVLLGAGPVLLVIPFIANALDRRWPAQAPFKVIPYEKSAWGALFAVVGEDRNHPLHIMRHKPAREQCAVMNQTSGLPSPRALRRRSRSTG